MRISESASRPIAWSQLLDWGLPLAGIVLVVVGYFFGPWVDHRTSGLVVTGSELSWFAKWFPQVSGRAWFAVPPIAAAVLLGLVTRRLALHPIVRLGVVVLGVLLVLASLPAYDPVLSPEYREQLVLAVVGMVLVFLTLLAHRVPGRIWGVLVASVALVGAVPALWQFALLHPLVATVYEAPVGLGWGLILCVVGFALLLLRGVLAVAGRSPAAR